MHIVPDANAGIEIILNRATSSILKQAFSPEKLELAS